MAILVANGVLTYLDVRAIVEIDRAVFRSRDFLGKLSVAMKLCVDAETGQHDFLLTGDPEYLVPYRNARAPVDFPGRGRAGNHPDDGPALKVSRPEVTTTRTIKKPSDIAAIRDFTLVISDIGLPDGSGLGLKRNVSSRRPDKTLALTGYGMEEAIRRSREAGFLASTRPSRSTLQSSKRTSVRSLTEHLAHHLPTMTRDIPLR